MPELFTEFSIDLYQRYILRGDVSDGLLSKMWKRHKFFSMSKEKISYTIMQSSDYSGPQPFLTNYYTGDGYSGTVFGRPALKQMEDAIRAGMVYAVLVKIFLIWDGITVAKLIESRKDIQKLMEQQQKMDKR